MHSYVTLRSKENGKESSTQVPRGIATEALLVNSSFYQYTKAALKYFPSD